MSRERIEIEELETKKKKKKRTKSKEHIEKLEKAKKRTAKVKTKDGKKERKRDPTKKLGRPFNAATKKRTTLDPEGLKEIPEEVQKILDMIEEQELDIGIATQVYMFRAILKMLPVTEAIYYDKPTQQNVYAFNAVVTQARELIADFQAKKDNSKVLDNILYQIMQPTLMTFVQFLMDSNHQLNKQLKDIVKETKHKQLKSIIDDTTKSMGIYGQEMFATLKERLPSALE